MGSCVSRAPPASAGSVATAAKVIDIDGFLAQIAAPVTASEALGTAASARFFLCSSDELRFDAPARALAADEPLQPGWLYFALPLPMLRRPLSGQEMAALAVKATSALALARTRRRKAGRVSPLHEGENRKVDGIIATRTANTVAGARRWGRRGRGLLDTEAAALVVVQQLARRGWAPFWRPAILTE